MSGQIALIIPYFGPLPHWFPYWVKSLERSRILDAHLFTDAHVPGKVPDNLKIHTFSLEEFSALASKNLSIPVHLKITYKVCDFKPAFAEIFAEYIRNYNFWAFGDLDLVYGNVDALLSPFLNDFDIVSFRKGWVSGSLCVLRNSERVNSLYRRSPDWKKVFASSKYMWFDEMGGFFYSEVLRGADVLGLRGAVESFTHVAKKKDREGYIRCAFSDMACEEIPWGETLIYDNGQLTRHDGSNVMYVHYVAMRRRFFVVPQTTRVPDRYYIRKTGIYLSRPGAARICTEEASRVALGSLRGAGRLVRRYAMQNARGG